MKALVVASQKGGVGKTTLALNLSLAFAEGGYRVLLIDTDPQGAIGLSLSKKLMAAPGVADCVAGEIAPAQAVVRTKIPGFHILPTGRLAPQETEAFSAAVADGARFRGLFERVAGDYELTIVDTPCGFGGITVGALRSGTHVVSPIQAEPIALRSIPQLLEMMRVLRHEGAAAEIVGFVLTMLQHRDERSLAVASDVWDMFPRELLFDANIPRDPVFLEATAAGVPVGMLRRPAPPVSHVFELIAADLAGRMGLSRARQADGPRPLLD